MTEFDFPSSTTTTNIAKPKPKSKAIDNSFPASILSDIVLQCSLIFSHPFHLSFFIFFFSSSLLRLLSFLFPLLLCIILLLAAVPRCSDHDVLLDHKQFEELLVFEIVFEEPVIEEAAMRRLDENPVHFPQVTEQTEENTSARGLGESDDHQSIAEEEDPVNFPQVIGRMNERRAARALGESGDQVIVEEGNPELAVGRVSKGEEEEEMIELLQEVIREPNADCSDESGKLTQCGLEKVDALPIDLYPNHEEQESMKESMMSGRESEATTSSWTDKSKSDDDDDQDQDHLGSHPGDHDTTCLAGIRHGKNNYGGFESSEPCGILNRGALRKEREWRRTLACKLFEERHNEGLGSEEGMDLLWEVHETKQSITTTMKLDHGDREDEDDVGFEGGKVCCLQALKLSAGKVSLGMGRPNITTISKVLKRIGWIRNSNTNRRRKKIVSTKPPVVF